ncbi:MAG: FAD-dependent oxidoreductase [Chloroflexi bacterium]|nr:FAD-dependent oxidoreductase [Chloroflexota bacterium]
MLRLKDTRWDLTADIVVAGYGLAGAVAAITAHDKGARVIILEKQSVATHCSGSSISGGLFLCVSDIARAVEHMTALCQADGEVSWTDPDVIRVWAEYTSQNKDWLERLGGHVKFYCKTAEYPDIPGADSFELWQYRGRGLHMMHLMYDLVASRNIKVMYQTRAERLLTNTAVEVTGIRATSAEGGQPSHVNIKVTRAVILCTGGFEGDEAMKLQYLGMHPVYFTGGMANTGDGIKMGQEVGADLWHMNCVSARLVAKFLEFPWAFFIDFGGKGWQRRQIMGLKEKAAVGFIIVDRYGRRYMNENLKPHAAFYELTAFDTHRREYYRVPSYHIFDRKRMEYGPMTQRSSGASGPHQLYKWSADNSAELQKGWIIKGDTVAELAERIGVLPSTLENTVKTWNGYCAAGRDPEFGRNPLEMVSLDSPPFFAIRLFPGGPNTQGGPRRNCRAQVLNPFGEPIPGLYAAGECGSIYGKLYPVGGSNLAECIAFGRIAAENAIQEKERA